MRIHEDPGWGYEMLLTQSAHELLIHDRLTVMQVCVYYETIVKRAGLASELASRLRLQIAIGQAVVHVGSLELNLFWEGVVFERIACNSLDVFAHAIGFLTRGALERSCPVTHAIQEARALYLTEGAARKIRLLGGLA